MADGRNGSVSGYDFVLKGLTDPPTFNSFKPIGSLDACLGCPRESKTKKNFEAEQFTYYVTKPFLGFYYYYEFLQN